MKARTRTFLESGLIFALLAISSRAYAQESTFDWKTVVNNGDQIPGSTEQFFSYNQPSINQQGLVVFRARAKDVAGGEGDALSGAATPGSGTVRGIFQRDMSRKKSVIEEVAMTGEQVPAPNNTDARFNEFPSFPRIDAHLSAFVFRGQSQPVYEYTLPDGSDTKVGTSGLYWKARPKSPVTCAASQLGAVPGFEYSQVPGAAPGTKFDQFPGAPTLLGRKLVFKGNYSEDQLTRTGVFYRNMKASAINRGEDQINLIANSKTLIPGQGSDGAVTFGSTAPPSAAGTRMVFTGWDNEEFPAMGGIYSAPLKPNPELRTIVAIGNPVPGVEGASFINFGEGLSFSGRYLAFWAAWGAETKTMLLTCPTDGNKDLLAFCQAQYPLGFPAQEPLNQGIFVYDGVSGKITMLARTGADNLDDFLYWTFSGRVPGVGDSEAEEPARWRSAAFAAVSPARGGTAAFKASKVDGTQGIYLGLIHNPSLDNHLAVIDSTMDGNAIDPAAPQGVKVTTVGLERDGFRGRRLAITASMANEDASLTWGGIYLTRPPVRVDMTPQ